jgi:hypothetical protein
MATIQQHHERISQLKLEVQAAWRKACNADGINHDSKFVVFTNTIEAAVYNELMCVYQNEVLAYHAQMDRNAYRRERTQMIADMGLKRVRGALGGTYVE